MPDEVQLGRFKLTRVHRRSSFSEQRGSRKPVNKEEPETTSENAQILKVTAGCI